MQQTVSLKEAAELVIACGNVNTLHFQGEPGIGKSSMLATIAAAFPNHLSAYIDGTQLDLGDTGMPVVVKEGDTWVTHYAPNARFLLQYNKPVIIMLDELTKAPRPVQNMLMPLILEHRFGDVPLPEGSIVFSTGNMSQDNVGDAMQPHGRNRLSIMTVRKPDAEEWIPWATDNDVAPEIVAFIHQYPHVLASYMDAGQADNPYIYNPKKQQMQFATPRSLAKAGNIVKQRARLSDNALTAALDGTIGAPASRDLMAFLHVAMKLPTRSAIIAGPLKADVPDMPMGQIILALGAAQWCDEETIDKWMKYNERLMAEVQALFATTIIRSSRAKIATSCKAFAAWAVKNNFLF